MDHVESKSGLSVRLMGLKMLILDEADHLLDLGFRKDIEKIVDALPRKRQSLLFSATIPKEVRRVSHLVLKRGHDFIDTVGIGSVETPLKVRQSWLVVPHDQHFQVIYHLLKEHNLQTPDYKVMVFCTTGMVTSLLYLLLQDMKMNVREIHSRKPQIYRTRISDEFRESKRLILVTSDVSSRGMNYPDVTLVIQVGIPYDREHYIHRLGRTGREGKDGEGILLLAPWEQYFLNEINDLPMERLPLPCLDPESNMKVESSLSRVDTSVREGAYHAWLGYYNSIREIGRDKTTLVELAKQFSDSIRLQNPPSLFRKTAVKMGLKEAASANPIEKHSESSDNRDVVLARLETEKWLALIKAWEESEKSKAENKAFKRLSAVEAWENSEKAAVEAKLKKKEEKMERKKAEYAERMKNMMTDVHKAAEQKRAMVEAKRGEDIVKVEEKAGKFLAKGYTPKRLMEWISF